MAEQRYNVDHTPSSQAYAGSDPNEIKKYAEDETYSEKGAEADNSANISYPTGGRLALITVALMLVIFLAALDQTILGTAIPKITDEFSGLDKVSWYGTAYFMTSGGFQSSWGKAPRYFSLKGAFLTALAIFELGSLLCAVAPNAEVFIVGRAIAGLGCAGLVSESMTIVAFSVEPTQRPKFLGFVGSCYGLGSVCGPLIGGAFTSHVTWRWCFYLNLPIGAIAAAVVIFSFSTPVQAKPLAASWRTKIANLDPGGAMLMMAVIVCFTLAMQYGGQTMAWGSTTVVGLLVGFAVILVLFTAWQFWRGDQAMMPPRVVAQRTVWPGAAFQFFFAAPYFIALYYLPIYFQSVDDVSPIESGIRNMPLVLGMTFSTVAAGIVTTKTGYTTPLAVLGATLATVACGLFYTFDQGTSTGRWIAYQLIGGISWGTAWQVALNNMQARVETADVPTAVSTYFTLQCIGGAFGLAAAQNAFDNRLVQALATMAPGVDPAAVLATGSTQLRTGAFPAFLVPGIVDAYMAGLRVVFALTIGLAGMSLLLSFAQGWRRVPSEADRKAGGEEGGDREGKTMVAMG